jgi:type IV pilus assembly protein PilA
MYTKRLNRAFTLIELLAVIAIIGVITAVSMPIYNHYLVSSRASMLWALADEAKLEVESTFLRSPTGISNFSVAPGAAAYTSSNANFVSCIVINNGVVSVVGNPAQLNAQNIWISFVPNTANNTLEWGCYYSNIASQYFTGNCQISGAAPQCS